MGCGCRKTKKANISLAASKMQELTPAQRQAFRDAAMQRSKKSIEKTKVARRQQHNNNAIEASRRQICEKCPHAVYNNEASDNKFKICEKCNRPLFVIWKDLPFECPMAKFSGVKV